MPLNEKDPIDTRMNGSLALEDQPNATAHWLEDKGAEVPNQAAVWEESEAGKYQLPGGKE